MNNRRNASLYCNYNEVFGFYDQNRQPNGLKELLLILSQNCIPVEEQTVLEGGFGTGAYVDHLRNHVKTVHGVEGSEQGMEEAIKKTGHADNVHLQIGDILDLSFGNDVFDAYLINQVLHHLDTEPSYPNLTRFLKESRRVLKPGGILTINTCSQTQLDPQSGAYWNYRYLEKAAHALQKRYIPVQKLISKLEKMHFFDIQTTIPSGRLFPEHYYRDPLTVLGADFQKADSIYCFLAEKDIKAANIRIRSVIDDGSVHRQMAQVSTRARSIGESVIISARKPM